MPIVIAKDGIVNIREINHLCVELTTHTNHYQNDLLDRAKLQGSLVMFDWDMNVPANQWLVKASKRELTPIGDYVIYECLSVKQEKLPMMPFDQAYCDAMTAIDEYNRSFKLPDLEKVIREASDKKPFKLTGIYEAKTFRASNTVSTKYFDVDRSSSRSWGAFRDGRGSEVRYIWFVNRNLAGYFIGFRRVKYANGSHKDDQFTARRSKKRLKNYFNKKTEVYRERTAKLIEHNSKLLPRQRRRRIIRKQLQDAA